MSDTKTKKSVERGWCGVGFFRCLAILPVVLAICFFAIDKWLAEKSYEFDYREISFITKRASENFGKAH